MPLFDHIGELRRRFTIIIVTLLFASIVLFFVAPALILFLIQPVSEYFGAVHDIEEMRQVLVTLNPLDGFALKFKVGLVCAIIVCCPIWIWQLLGFFLPALKPNERKWVIPTFAAAIVLFVLGAVFCYTLILAPAFNWLLSQSDDFSTVMAAAPDFINTILLFEIGFGIAFELPLVVFYLTIFNIVPYKKLRASWRVVYLVLMVVCGMITPDANPVTMILMFAAMAILYEGALLLSRVVLTRRIARQKREEAGELDDDDDDDDDDEGDD